MNDPYKIIESHRKANETNKIAAATGYFDHKYKVKKPKSAAELESLICELIRCLGGKVEQIYSGGHNRVSQSKTKDVMGNERTITQQHWQGSTTTAGTADILGTLKGGKAIAIEVKYSKSDRLSDKQILWGEQWKSTGAAYIVAKNLGDVLTYIKELDSYQESF